MTPTVYVLQALAYSAGGFVVGYVVCWATRRAAEGDAAFQGRRVEWWRIPLGLLLLVLVAYTTISSVQFSACQRDANTALAAALRERATAQREWIGAQREFLRAVSDPAASPAGRAAAYHAYLAALDRLDSVQTANPLNVRDCS